MSWEERTNYMAKLYPDVSRDRMERAYMTTVMNYDHAFECASMMMEPEEGYYIRCIRGL